MKEKHPPLTALRDVPREIAEAYAASLNGGRLSPNTYNKDVNLLTLVFRVLKHKAKLPATFGKIFSASILSLKAGANSRSMS